MYRSPVARRLYRAGLAALLVLLLGGVRPATAIEEIWRLEVDITEIIRKMAGDREHHVTRFQAHYAIQFEPDESFVFIVPKEFLGRGRSGVFSDGSTRYRYRLVEDEPLWVGQPDLIYLWIPNRVLAYREAFLAAEPYFAAAAQRAGLPLRFWRDDPIEVVIGEPRPGAGADTAFWRHRIVMKPTSTMDPHLTAVHEYFHLVQDAVWYAGDEDDYWKRYRVGSEDPFHTYLSEMTAEWSTDEPIQVRGVGGRPSESLDAKNDYLDKRGQYFLRHNKQPFFQTNKYDANLFIKYLAEQIAGKKDESAAEQVLTLIARMFERGGVNRENFFQVVAEMAPSADFGAPTRSRRWSKFFRAFSASNVVQRGASLEDPKAPAGYWDDAFTARTAAFLVDADHRREEASRPSDRVYAEPARDDSERRQRLDRLIGEDELVEALSYRVYVLDLSSSRRRTAPRPIFLMARGVPGTDLFLLGQRYPLSDGLWERKSARFSWHPDFTFSDQGEVSEPRVYYEFPDFEPGTGSEALWVGLVNSGPDLKSKVVAWAYQASPRIIPQGFRPHDGGTETVRLVGGSAYLRFNPDEGFYNGDTFELKIDTTGRLHREGADLTRLAPEDVAARLRVLDERGGEILLDTSGGEPVEIRVTGTPTKYYHYWTYSFSGKFAEDNPDTGKGRFEIRITSPLNLGGDDEEVDDSYAFTLRGIHPLLWRLTVSSDDPEILYDSEKGLRRVPVPRDDAYELDVEATFSLPMSEGSVEITAGRAPPFDSYRVGRVGCGDEFKICGGRLTVPAGEVPAAGMLLRFAVGGESLQGEGWTAITGRLDADPLEPGPQPDIRHFVVLGVEELYRLTQSSRVVYEADKSVFLVRGDIGPLDFEFDLFPNRMDRHGRPTNPYLHSMETLVEHSRDLLGYVKKAIEALEKEYEEASDDPEEYAERFVEALKERRASMEFLASVEIPEQLATELDLLDLERPEQLGPPTDLDLERERRRRLREEAALLGKGIEASEEQDEEELGKELVESLRMALGKQRSRRAFLEARYLPLIEAAHRVMNGYKSFTYREELSGPVPFSFAGLRVEWHSPGGPYPEDWASHAGKMGGFSFGQGRLSAGGWSVDVDRLYERSPARGGWDPELFVWDFWPSDLEKVQMLLDLSYPDSFAKAPEDGVSAWIEVGEDEGFANFYAENLADNTNYELFRLCDLMWSFFPESQRPDLDLSMSNLLQRLDEVRRICRLPLVDGTRLIRLTTLRGVQGLPIDLEGYDFGMSYEAGTRTSIEGGKIVGRWIDDETAQQPMMGGPPLIVYDPIIVERPGYRDVTVSTIYDEGQTVRRDVRYRGTFDWVEEDFGIWGYFSPSAMWDYFSPSSNWFPEHLPEWRTWSIVDSSSPQAVVNPKAWEPWLLIQTAEEVAHGTLQGQRQWEGVDIYGTGSIRWNTHYRVERIGQTPVPDPAEPLPEWTEPGEEPRREPTPTPRPAPAPRAEPPRESWVRSYDPNTGVTTESRRDPDGSVTVTRTDRDGEVLSQETRPPGQRQPPSASATDPRSGVTTRAERTPDGATRISQTDRAGNLLSERLVER